MSICFSCIDMTFSIADVIMIIITMIYVGATIFIWLANSKSAKAAEKQLEEIKKTNEYYVKSQQQNVALQLLEMRKDVYFSTIELFTHANILLNEDVSELSIENCLVSIWHTSDPTIISLTTKVFINIRKMFECPDKECVNKCLNEITECELLQIAQCGHLMQKTIRQLRVSEFCFHGNWTTDIVNLSITFDKFLLSFLMADEGCPLTNCVCDARSELKKAVENIEQNNIIEEMQKQMGECNIHVSL